MSEEQRKRRRKTTRTADDGPAAETAIDDAPTTEADLAAPATAAAVMAPPTTRMAAGGGGLLHKIRLDPAIGLGIFVPGLFVMALGGAMTWHWIFNIGEAVMLLGMTHFVAAVMLTALQQRSDRKALAAPAPAPPATAARSKPERSTPAATSTPAET